MQKDEGTGDKMDRARALYGVWERASASNNVEEMKSALEGLRKRKGESPDVDTAIKKLEDAIEKIAPSK